MLTMSCTPSGRENINMRVGDSRAMEKSSRGSHVSSLLAPSPPYFVSYSLLSFPLHPHLSAYSLWLDFGRLKISSLWKGPGLVTDVYKSTFKEGNWLCGSSDPVMPIWTSLVTQVVKNLPAMQETQVRSLGWEDPLEKGIAIHSSILAWRISWTEIP